MHLYKINISNDDMKDYKKLSINWMIGFFEANLNKELTGNQCALRIEVLNISLIIFNTMVHLFIYLT